jgi:hypothetical protein
MTSCRDIHHYDKPTNNVQLANSSFEIRSSRCSAVRVVIACRTFDLEHDPLLRNWLSATKSIRINVAEIDEAQLKSELGDAVWNGLPIQERRLLQQVLNLHLWRTLCADGREPPPFASSLDLTREFWKDVYRRIDRVPGASGIARQALAALAETLQTSFELSVPERRFPTSLAVGFELLQSLGIVRHQERRIGFWHQSFGDYQIVESLLRRIETSEGLMASALAWIRQADSQSLFKRRQVQLLLQVVADAHRDEFLSLISSIIDAADIRFHVKLLCPGSAINGIFA